MAWGATPAVTSTRVWGATLYSCLALPARACLRQALLRGLNDLVPALLDQQGFSTRNKVDGFQ